MVKVFKPVTPFSEKNQTIFEQEKEYYKNLVEFAGVNYQQILKRATTTNTSTTVYQIPTGSTYFITSCSFNFVAEPVNLTGYVLEITEDNASAITYAILIEGYALAGSTSPVFISKNFPMPIRVREGQFIRLRPTAGANAGMFAAVTIQGFLVPFLP